MTVVESSITAGVTGRSAWAPLLKTVYGPLWQLHVHTKVVVSTQIMKPKGRMGGKALLSAFINSLPQSSGINLFEYDDLPTPRTLTAAQPELHTKDFYTRLQVTGNVLRAAAMGDVAAWANPLTQQLKYARDQFSLNVARKLYLSEGDVMSKIQSAYETDGAETVTVFGRNARTSLAADWFKFGVHYLRQNMSVYFTAANTPFGDPQNWNTANYVERYILNVPDGSNVDSPRFVLNADPQAGTVVQNGYVFTWGSRKDAGTNSGATVVESYFAGPNGLAKLAGDSNLYSWLYTLTRSSYPTLSGVRTTNNGNGQAFSEMMLSLTIDNISDDGVGSEPNVAICHRSARREVVKELRGQRLFPTVIEKSGHSQLTFMAGDTAVPYVVDRDCPPGLFALIDTETMGWLTNSDMGPMETGSERFITNKDAKEFDMHMSGNEFCTLPKANGFLEDVTFRVDRLTA